MTTDNRAPARDVIGRFTPQEHTAPELDLVDGYLEDDTDGAEFDVHNFYDAGHHVPDSAPDAVAFDPSHSDEEEDAFRNWLDEMQTPQGIDEQFDRPDPTLTPVAAGEQVDIGAWGSATPF